AVRSAPQAPPNAASWCSIVTAINSSSRKYGLRAAYRDARFLRAIRNATWSARLLRSALPSPRRASSIAFQTFLHQASAQFNLAGRTTVIIWAWGRITSRRPNGTERLPTRGCAPAQFNVGVMYDNGEGVPQNCAE